jgi:hypothetical protein
VPVVALRRRQRLIERRQQPRRPHRARSVQRERSRCRGGCDPIYGHRFGGKYESLFLHRRFRGSFDGSFHPICWPDHSSCWRRKGFQWAAHSRRQRSQCHLVYASSLQSPSPSHPPPQPPPHGLAVPYSTASQAQFSQRLFPQCSHPIVPSCHRHNLGHLHEQAPVSSCPT